jgi:hypothetical protein
MINILGLFIFCDDKSRGFALLRRGCPRLLCVRGILHLDLVTENGIFAMKKMAGAQKSYRALVSGWNN